MVHEGAKLNNFNAVCLIIVAHEGAKFNEPGDGLTNQLCRRRSAFVRGELLRSLKFYVPFSIFQSIIPDSFCRKLLLLMKEQSSMNRATGSQISYVGVTVPLSEGRT